MIRVVIAEDQGLILGALAALLELEGDIEVVAQAKDGRSALEEVKTHQPDILITDIEMPHLSGLELAAEVKKLGLGTRVVIVTTFGRAGYLRRALEAGASGYLLKDAPSSELAEAVRRVYLGGRAIDPFWPRKPGARKTPSPTASAGCCAWPGRAAPAPRSPPS